jgi:A/G-specific adenine glycosylase
MGNRLNDEDFFRRQLLDWHVQTPRPMPWKASRDAYPIWLSEIILQQTRVAQGTPYFERFVAAFPTVQDLAAASETVVFKLWEGLGYYSRARNLMAAARKVVADYGGQFPKTYEGLLTLPGVGPYTAAAIASFAFDAPTAVVDGNVVRVLSRFGALDYDFSTGAGKKLLTQVAQGILPTDQSAIWNQALMNFGALQCTPGKPDCLACPVQAHCKAFAADQVDLYPIKKPKVKVQERFHHYLLVEQGDKIWLQRREVGDFWAGLHEFLLVTADELLDDEAFWALQPYPFLDKPMLVSERLVQKLTHRTVIAKIWHFAVTLDVVAPDGVLVVPKSDIKLYAMPRMLALYCAEVL